MKLEMFSVFDAATGVYGHPIFQVSTAQAIRSFEGAARDPSTQINKFSKDFSLFHIGTYDDSKALVENVIPPRHIASAHEFLRVAEVAQ